MVNDRTSRSKTDFLKDGNGKTLVDKEEIVSFIIDFCKSSMGSRADSCVGIEIQAIMVGPQLTYAQALSLTKPISHEKVVDVLNSIDDTKSPGLDGFSSLFFIKSWRIVKHDILVAVNDFFYDDIFFPPVSITVNIPLSGVFGECFE